MAEIKKAPRKKRDASQKPDKKILTTTSRIKQPEKIVKSKRKKKKGNK